LLPIGNLIVKAGWVATLADNQIHRSWSPMIVLQSIARTVTFEEELSWSLQLGLYSAFLSLVLAMGLTAFCRWSRWDAVVLGTMGCLLSLPGPMVNLAVIQLLDRSEPEWVGFLADRTLCAPILALQSRCWPIAFGILWLADQRFTSENQRQLTFDLVLPLSSQIWIRLRAMMRAMRIAFVVAFFVAFADLASYLLVQPPQVTTVAMRMFEMLHYGIKNRESGLALALVLLTIFPTWLLMRKTIR
jgi:ABC-type Fe3+ transport system permease subunit